LLAAARASDQPFLAHIVGRVDGVGLREIANDRRFIAHGPLNRRQISELVESSWIGLSSFALDRNLMMQACTLKVREYLSYGLPVYSGHDDIFREDFVYYKSGICSIDSILQAARQAIAWSRREVALEARPYIDKRALLEKLYGEIAAHGPFA
jgi:hypothetical protein